MANTPNRNGRDVAIGSSFTRPPDISPAQRPYYRLFSMKRGDAVVTRASA